MVRIAKNSEIDVCGLFSPFMENLSKNNVILQIEPMGEKIAVEYCSYEQYKSIEKFEINEGKINELIKENESLKQTISNIVHDWSEEND